MQRSTASSWKRYGLGLILALVIWLICPISWALSVTMPTTNLSLADVPNPRQENGGWISDTADLLSPQAETQLNQRIDQLDRKTTAELAIVTLPQINTQAQSSPQSTRDFALQLFNAWGIGKRGKNNGVLLLIARQNRKVEVITGTGLATALPDATVDRLIQTQILPAFRQGNYETGIIQGTNAIAQSLEENLIKSWVPMPMVGLLVGVGGLVVAIGYWQQRRYLQTPIHLTVPSQGYDRSTFKHQAIYLKEIAFTDLLEQLFNPDRLRVQQFPKWIAIAFGAGGTIVGLAIALGWQNVLASGQLESEALATSFLLSSTAWNNWVVPGLTFLVYGLSGFLGWLVMGLFIPNARNFEFLLLLAILLPMVLLTVIRFLAWPWVVLLVNGLTIGGLWLFSKNLFNYIPRRQYYGDRDGGLIQELETSDLANLLTAAETKARSMGNLSFRGWREANGPMVRDQVYLVCGQAKGAIACQKCQSFTVTESSQEIEKTIQVKKKIKGQKKEKVDSIVDVRQTTYHCGFCGHVWVTETVVDRANQGCDTNFSSDYTNDSVSNNVNYSDYNYDSNSSGGDFGGGSSDGGGASGDW